MLLGRERCQHSPSPALAVGPGVSSTLRGLGGWCAGGTGRREMRNRAGIPELLGYACFHRESPCTPPFGLEIPDSLPPGNAEDPFIFSSV